MKSTYDHKALPLPASRVKFRMLLAVLILTLSSCAAPGRAPTSTPSQATPTQVVMQPTITPESTPGLMVSGSVLDETGAGVEGVQIYRNYAAYPGELIATTDAHGQYTSAFYPIPGDEMVAVWAVKPGFVFKPEYCQWRHYYGYEEKECNFEQASQ